MNSKKDFGVFILRDGHWKLWAEYPGPRSAAEEVTYLTRGLGLTAQLFQRVSA